MTYSPGQRQLSPAEEGLRRAGFGSETVSFILEELAPSWYAEKAGASEETLVGKAVLYLQKTQAHRYQDPAVDITLVVPAFEDLTIERQYFAAADAAAAAMANVGPSPEAYALRRSWLRLVHRRLAARDFLGAGSLPFLPDAPSLELYYEGAADLLDVAPGTLDDGVVPGPTDAPAPTAPPLTLSEVLAEVRTADLFAGLPQLVGSQEERVRQDPHLTKEGRRAHQLVALTATVAAPIIGPATQRTFNLLIELDSPPQTGQRIMAEYPLLGTVTLRALKHTEPGVFATVYHPSDLLEPPLRSLWETVTLGKEQAGLTSEQGVVGLLADAASPALEALLGQAGEGQQ